MAERHVRLKAPGGVIAVEYGGEIYRVIDGHVVVPIMTEPALTRPDFGFTFPDEPKLLFESAAPVVKMAKRR